MSAPAPLVEFDLPERRGIGAASHAVALLGAASLLGWWFGAAPDMDESLRVMLGVAVAASFIPALLRPRRDPPCRLRHDGQFWWLSSGTGGEHVPQQGGIQVAIDVQLAMLLRFVAATGGRSTRVRWLAVGRRDLGPRWHEWRGVVIRAAAAHDRAQLLPGVDTSG